MALVTVISQGDFQKRWNVLSLSFSEGESRKWPLGLSDFYHNYLISKGCIQHTGRYPLGIPNKKNIQLHDFLCCVLTEYICSDKSVFQFWQY